MDEVFHGQCRYVNLKEVHTFIIVAQERKHMCLCCVVVQTTKRDWKNDCKAVARLKMGYKFSLKN